jgi:hypothetical protein
MNESFACQMQMTKRFQVDTVTVAAASCGGLVAVSHNPRSVITRGDGNQVQFSCLVDTLTRV